jgi:oligoendopeptidase F
MSTVISLPPRSEVKVEDTWDLSRLFTSDADWEAALQKLEDRIPGYADFRGKLGDGASFLAACLKYDSESERLADRLANYAYLKTTEDQTNSTYQRLLGRLQNVATRAGEAASYIRPEIMAISDDVLAGFLKEPEMELYQLLIERMVRYKKYTLSDREEQILAMQGEMAGAAGKIFRQLLDADLKFGLVENEKGESVELTQSTFSQLLESPQRNVRRTAFHQFYEQFAGHENSLAATLHGAVQKDVYYARVRGYDSCLQQALFADNVPQTVYDNLIATVRQHLPTLYRFYDLRRRKMGLDDIHHYDTYVPIVSEIEKHHTWDEASQVIVDALAPLGPEYCSVLKGGLAGRWCDRYPNQHKQSGAFSYGTYDGDPYIMMNYQPELLRDVFTLAHEAGHSMHSYLSIQNQPFEYHHYTIFVAEVASTFNEQLLTRHLLEQAADDRERAYLVNNEIDDIRATIIRQTMFAEFEKVIHEMVEGGEPLTVEALKQTYGKLLNDYFGPDFVIDEELPLECLRIPHFYRAFYVYKYATGLSAAIALSQRVLEGGTAELDAYLGFLKSGCNKFPLDLLRDAGVDLETPQPVEAAMNKFASLVDQLDDLL